MFTLIGAMVAGNIVLAAADTVPTYNVDPGCRAAASRAKTPDYFNACLKDEEAARQKIVQQWSQFGDKAKSECLPVSSLGGQPTYTELLTCLEMTRDALNLRKNNTSPAPPTTTGQDSR
jgi:hypothetical protein